MITKIIKFGAPWSTACTAVDTALEQLQAIKPEIEVSKVNIEEDEATTELYKVKGLPTIVFLNDENKEMGRNVGRCTIQEILSTINGHGI